MTRALLLPFRCFRGVVGFVDEASDLEQYQHSEHIKCELSPARTDIHLGWQSGRCSEVGDNENG